MNISPKRCVDTCTMSGYSFAGLQYKTQCICANEHPHGARQNESSCDYICPGDASANCGGHWMMSVYQTTDTPTTATTTSTTTTTTTTPTTTTTTTTTPAATTNETITGGLECTVKVAEQIITMIRLCINPLLLRADECIISPTIAYENYTLDEKHPATSALTDYVNDDRLSNSPLTYNYWVARRLEQGGFVIDLGCTATVNEVHLRNAYMAYNRSVTKNLLQVSCLLEFYFTRLLQWLEGLCHWNEQHPIGPMDKDCWRPVA